MDVGEAAAAGSGRAAAPVRWLLAAMAVGRGGLMPGREARGRSLRAASAADRLGGCLHFFRLGGVSGDDREPGCFSTAVKIHGGLGRQKRPPPPATLFAKEFCGGVISWRWRTESEC